MTTAQMTVELMAEVRKIAESYNLGVNYIPKADGRFQLAIQTPGMPYAECVYTSWKRKGYRWDCRDARGLEIANKVVPLLKKAVAEAVA